MKSKHRIKEQKGKSVKKKGIKLVPKKVIPDEDGDIQFFKSDDAVLELGGSHIRLVVNSLLHYEWNRSNSKLTVHFHAPELPGKLGITKGFKNVVCSDCNTVVYYNLNENRWFDLNGSPHTCLPSGKIELSEIEKQRMEEDYPGIAAKGRYATDEERFDSGTNVQVEDTSAAQKTGEWEKQS